MRYLLIVGVPIFLAAVAWILWDAHKGDKAINEVLSPQHAIEAENFKKSTAQTEDILKRTNLHGLWDNPSTVLPYEDSYLLWAPVIENLLTRIEVLEARR